MLRSPSKIRLAAEESIVGDSVKVNWCGPAIKAKCKNYPLGEAWLRSSRKKKRKKGSGVGSFFRQS
jgi:hypothetical protein